MLPRLCIRSSHGVLRGVYSPTLRYIHSSMAAAASAGEGFRAIITRRLPPQCAEYLKQEQSRLASAGTPLELLYHESDDPLDHDKLSEWASTGVDGIYCLLSDSIPAAIVEAAGDKLKVVSTMSAGFNHVDTKACIAKKVRVGHTPDALTDTTADLAVGLLLASARKIVQAAAAVKGGEWTTWKPMWLTGPDVYKSTVGIVGMGKIGTAIARRLGLGFGCKILYTGGSGRKPAAEEAAGGAEYRELGALLEESRFVIVACALNDKTRHLIGKEQLAAMGPDSILVNIGRGELVDQEALIEALEGGTIAGAGLDVTTPEPLPTDSPLLRLPNCVVLPHIGSASVPTRELIAKMAVQNLVAGLEGKELPFGVKGT